MAGFVGDYLVLIIIIAAFVILVIAALYDKLKVVKYTVYSEKVNKSITLALVTDLHSCKYGKRQCELLGIIKNEKPDAILLGGDIIDDLSPITNALDLLSGLSEKYRCFYVTGNHEVKTKHVDVIKKIVGDYGITVLDGQEVSVAIKDNVINIFGIDDDKVLSGCESAQLAACNNRISSNNLSVMLVHRPENIDEYSKCLFEIVAAGHTHGGQVRIPYILNGLYSSHQGLFPKYSGGIYKVNNTTLIVSRGLARRHVIIPRVFNRPEVVFIKIINKG